MATHRVYVGTYTGKGSEGIYVLELDSETGALTSPRLAAATQNPSFLAVHPSGRYLYAVGEIGNFEGQKAGAVGAFAIDAATGALSPLGQRSSRGGGPCYISIDREGRFAFVANYGGGSVAALPIQDDGHLGDASGFVQHTGRSVDPKRQNEPHAHSIAVDPGNRFVIAADLGLDRLLVYRLDPATGALTPHDPPYGTAEPGAGPRLFAFHPNGRWLYVINEMGGTVTAYEWDAQRGSMQALHSISTLPPDWTGRRSCAEVQVHPSGRFLYGSNRGHDSIAAFTIHESTGRLAAAGHTPSGGKEPRNFTIDPSGRWLIAANQNSGDLVVFEIAPDSGALRDTGHRATVSMPVCVRVMPA